MPRPLAVVLAVAIVACSTGGLETVEAAEAYARERGVTLAEKAENTRQSVAPRAFDYRVGEVQVGIMQFHTLKAATTWKDAMDQSPFASEHRVQKGAVIFQIWDGADADRQKVIAALEK